MTIKYVSNTASNGYVVGSDSNNGTSPTTPYLTLDFALAHVSNGDTLIVNDGTQTAATFFSVGNGITLTPVTDYGTTLVAGAGTTSRVMNVLASQPVTIGKFIVDTLGLTVSGIINNSGTSAQLTLTGTKLQNSGAAGTTAQFINDVSAAQPLWCTDIVFSGAVTTAGIVATGNASKIVVVDGVTGTITGLTGSAANTGGVLLSGSASGARALIRRVGLSVTTNNATVTCGVIHAIGFIILAECNKGMSINEAVANSNSGVILVSPGAFLSEHSIICRNKGGNNCTGGYLVRVGSDAAGANDNNCNYPIVFRNDFTGNAASTSMHGYLLANIKGGCVTNNKARNVALDYVSKLQSEKAYFVDNKTYNSKTGGSGCFRAKGSTKTVFVGNTIYSNSGSANLPMYVTNDPGVPTASTGIIMWANSVYNNAVATTAVNVDSTSDATFNWNNYFFSAGVSGTPFSYQGTTYSTVALWSTARELTSRAITPTLINTTFWEDQYKSVLYSELSSESRPLYNMVVGT